MIFKFNLFKPNKRRLSHKRFMLYYSGFLNEDMLGVFCQTLKIQLKNQIDDSMKIKKIFSIFVELSQNLIRYGLEAPKGKTLQDEDRYGFGSILVYEEDDGQFIIQSENFIRSEAVPEMQDRLDKIYDLSYDKLRALYKEQIRTNVNGSSKGAGLGLTELARQSVKPIEATFKKSNDEVHFFSIKAFVK